MLTTLTRKLCPLMTLALATISCGKKIEEPTSTPNRTRENHSIPSTYIINLDGSQGSRKNHILPEYASFELPDRLKVRKGSTANKVIEIAYEVNPYDNDDFQFKCFYVPSENPAEMVLTQCVDIDGDYFGNVSGQLFGLRKNDIIQMRFTGANAPDLMVEAIYSMDWD